MEDIRKVKPCLKIVLFIFFCIVSCPEISYASVSTDGTMGPTVSLSGPDYLISHDLGSFCGKNLFHSFQDFSLAEGQSATFTGPETVANVINRVTGGKISSIDGLLRSQIGNADFYFINPAGVVFGPNAQVDVPATFHVSTADELRFADESEFSATNPKASTLTVAQPEAFGFLSVRPATISINGSFLSFNPGSDVSLSGGDIEIAGTENSWGGIIAKSGQIKLAAVGNAVTTVPVNGKTGEVSGNLNVQGAQLLAWGNGGGEILVDAGDATISDSRVHSDSRGNMDAENNRGIHITVKNIDIEGSAVTSDAMGAGDSSPVRINAREAVSVKNGGEIRSSVFDDGSSGGVTIEAGRLLIDGGGQDWPSIDLIDTDIITGIAAEVINSSATGNAGAIDIQVAGDALIQNYGGISTSTVSPCTGNAGNITLKAGELKIDGKELFAGITSETNGSGKGGRIDITVDGKFEVSSAAFVSSSTYNNGDSGEITISAENLNMDNYAHIRSVSSSSGNAGNVSVTIDGMLEMDHMTFINSSTEGSGTAGSVIVRANQIGMDGYSRIISETNYNSQGNAGIVNVKADGIIKMYNGANISASTKGYSTDGDDGVGNAGSVTVKAGDIRMDAGDSFAYISSDTIDATGDAGPVEVTVDNTLEILNGAYISSSSTRSEGNAGSVWVQAKALKINNGHSRISSDANGSVSDTHYTGNANRVDVTVHEKLEISNGARISSDTSTAGDAGSVSVSAKEIWINGMGKNGTKISSQAERFSTGLAGNIKVEADHISLVKGGEISVTHYGSLTTERLELFQSGFLNVEADFLELTGESKISASSIQNVPASDILLTVKDKLVIAGSSSITTSANTGDGGDIIINPEVIMLRNGMITTSSLLGDGGTIKIDTDILVADTGFIQANTAEGAKGGDIYMNSLALIAEGNELEVGGEYRRTFEAESGLNIIQAAAPGGEQGTIQITAPELDISGALVETSLAFFSPVRLATDPCSISGGQGKNSLVFEGPVGYRASPWNFLDICWDNFRIQELDIKE